MNIQFILNKIKLEREVYSDAELAKIFDVSPAAVSNWKARKRMPMSVIQRYCNENNTQITDYISPVLKTKTRQKQPDIKNLNEKVSIKDNNIEIIEDLDMVDAKYIIDLQKDKIKQQEKEISMYRDYIDTQPLQKLQFDEIMEDMSSTVEVRNVFSLKPMERKMAFAKGSEKLEKALGLPKGHGYFAPNKWFGFNSHPVDAIIAKDTLKELKGITKTLPSLFESLKFMVGNHYMSFPVIYEYKNKRVRTMCYILLDWMSAPKKILTKSILLNGNRFE
tara:strand:+ start:104 stop:934 length:831 start_codon:yes stop_codon:yes gene_type:complete